MAAAGYLAGATLGVWALYHAISLATAIHRALALSRLLRGGEQRIGASPSE